jgi:hypothetical protein
LKSQLERVETALALVRVRRGLISAGYNQGSSSQVDPKKKRKRKRPKTAPFAAEVVPGMRQAKVMIMEIICPQEPTRNICRGKEGGSETLEKRGRRSGEGKKVERERH